MSPQGMGYGKPGEPGYHGGKMGKGKKGKKRGKGKKGKGRGRMAY